MKIEERKYHGVKRLVMQHCSQLYDYQLFTRDNRCIYCSLYTNDKLCNLTPCTTEEGMKYRGIWKLRKRNEE